MRDAERTPQVSGTLYDALLGLSFAYGDSGRLAKQRAVAVELLDLSRSMRATGASYPVLSNALSQYANSHFETGKFRESRVAIAELHKLLQENGLADHSQAWRAHWLLANIEYRSGNVEAAETFLRHAIDTFNTRVRRRLDVADRATLTLASIRLDKGYVAGAELLVNQTIAAANPGALAGNPIDDKTLLNHRLLLGQIELKRGEYQRAVNHLSQVLQWREATHDAASPVIAMTRSHLAEALFGVGRDVDAQSQLDLAAAAFADSTEHANHFQEKFNAITLKRRKM